MAEIRTLTAADYHEDRVVDRPTLSASIAHLLLTSSPRHAWTAHPKLNPDFERKAEEKFDVGTVAHALLLQGETIVEVVDATDWRTKAAQEARDAARDAGRVPLLARHWQAVRDMVDAAREQLAAVDADPAVFAAGRPEQTLAWEEDGVACRALVDWLHDDHRAVDDLKTTARSAHPDSWGRTMFSIGADVQAAFYLRGIRAITGSDPVFRFCVVETAPPYALSIVSLSPDALALADAKVDAALRLWRACLDANDWPAYPRQVCFVEAPPWAEAQWLEREAREAA